MASVRTPPGQPLAPEEELRSERLELRLTPTEVDGYTAAAKANELSLSAWARQHLAEAAKTKSSAPLPIALKNSWAVKERIQTMHQMLLNHPDQSDELIKALLDQIVMLREPINFLINFLIEERRS